jgi:hypothetical protein
VWRGGKEGGSPSQLDIFTAEIILQIDEFSFSVLFFHPAQKIFFYIVAQNIDTTNIGTFWQVLVRVVDPDPDPH